MSKKKEDYESKIKLLLDQAAHDLNEGEMLILIQRIREKLTEEEERIS